MELYDSLAEGLALEDAAMMALSSHGSVQNWRPWKDALQAFTNQWMDLNFTNNADLYADNCVKFSC